MVGPVVMESRVRGSAHARFGGRSGETGRPQCRHRASLRPYEVWFSILSRQALKHSSFGTAREVRDRIDAFIQAYNRDARPFRWRASDVRPSSPRPSIADLPK